MQVSKNNFRTVAERVDDHDKALRALLRLCLLCRAYQEQPWWRRFLGLKPKGVPE